MTEQKYLITQTLQALPDSVHDIELFFNHFETLKEQLNAIHYVPYDSGEFLQISNSIVAVLNHIRHSLTNTTEKKQYYSRLFPLLIQPPFQLYDMLLIDNRLNNGILQQGIHTDLRLLLNNLVIHADAIDLGKWSIVHGYNWVTPADIYDLTYEHSKYGHQLKRSIVYHLFTKELSYHKNIFQSKKRVDYLRAKGETVDFDDALVEQSIQRLPQTMQVLKGILKTYSNDGLKHLFFEYSNLLLEVGTFSREECLQRNQKVLVYFAKIAASELATSQKIKSTTFSQLGKCVLRLDDEALILSYFAYLLVTFRSTPSKIRTLNVDHLNWFISLLVQDGNYSAARYELDLYFNLHKTDEVYPESLVAHTHTSWYTTAPIINHRRSLNVYADNFVHYITNFN